MGGLCEAQCGGGSPLPELGGFEAHLATWSSDVAEVRCHGTTGEVPRERFEREERAALKPLAGRPPFLQVRELIRVVNSEACVEVDSNRYSVPWRLIGETVTVVVESGTLRVCYAGDELARPLAEYEALLGGGW